MLSLALIVGLCFALTSASDVFAQRRQSALGKKESEDQNNPQANSKKQNPAASRRGPNQRVPVAPGQRKPGKEDEFAPQRITMDVKKEGIQLVATWFPPIIEEKGKKKKKNNEDVDPEPSKSVAPFILVHEWSRNRSDLLAMGAFLQSMGHAVIVPDLRGHGESTAMAGSSKALDYKDFRKANEKASAVRDIDQCKRFLQEKNNEGLLNIDLLNVVAVGDSAHLAIAWAISDCRNQTGEGRQIADSVFPFKTVCWIGAKKSRQRTSCLRAVDGTNSDACYLGRTIRCRQNLQRLHQVVAKVSRRGS
jgi:hypothetical protein